MPSPFPGMDPFIEGDSWQDFHLRFIGVAAELLTPGVRPRYVVRAQERVYLEHEPEDAKVRNPAPDISVVMPRGSCGSLESAGGATTAVAAAPAIVTLPLPVEIREPYLTILWRETMEVVTVIEVLSPSNKRRGSDGRREYLAKRETVLFSGTHLVELDLLRGGERLPTVQPLPPADYYAFVIKRYLRPNAQVYHWRLLQRMPAIPIPLATGDPDVTLDLQAVLDTVYDRSDYSYSLDYSRALDPPLSDDDAAQVQQALRSRGAGPAQPFAGQ